MGTSCIAPRRLHVESRLGRSLIRIFCIVVSAAAFFGARDAVAAGARAPDPRGVWMMQHHEAAIEIFGCRDALCGRIVWLSSPVDASGAPRRDVMNPHPAARAAPLCGLVVIEGMKRTDPETWGGGSVYNPLDGKTYSGRLRLDTNGTLDVRAYVGWAVLGQSETWMRVTGSALHASFDRTCARHPDAPEGGFKTAGGMR